MLTFSLTADLEKWDSVWAVNIRGPLLCYKYAAKQMVKQGSGGRIIGTIPQHDRCMVEVQSIDAPGASSVCGLKGRFNFQYPSRFLAQTLII
jgi:hypothetical protein